MRLLIKKIAALMIIGTALFDLAVANDTTHLGYDNPRKLISKAAKDSFIELENKYKNVLSEMKVRNQPESDEHITETISALILDQKLWMSFSQSHCNLVSYINVFPTGSRMFSSQYNSCKLEMNKKRIRYLNSIHYEYE